MSKMSMKQHPILFCGEMVRAILEDRKHQTRRMLKPQPVEHAWEQIAGHKLYVDMVKTDRGMAARIQHVLHGLTDTQWFTPKYQPGDQLWVRESIRAEELPSGLDGVRYLADGAFVAIENTREAGERWMTLRDYAGKRYATIPSIHMPRWASRIIREVADVRCQRVQEISEDDVYDEGVNLAALTAVEVYKSPERANRPAWFAFSNLWQSLNGNWNANPYVFAYTFRKL